MNAERYRSDLTVMYDPTWREGIWLLHVYLGT